MARADGAGRLAARAGRDTMGGGRDPARCAGRVCARGPRPVIATLGLTKRYGAVEALTGLTLEVRKGEVFGLLGPNGSGKTTTIRLLLGFLRPTDGRATVAGFDCWKQSLEVRR